MHSFFFRFVNDLQFHPLPIPGDHLVVQAVEQCFVGSLLHFGFRVCSSTRTASQIAHNSPFHLNNIVPKIGGSDMSLWGITQSSSLSNIPLLLCWSSSSHSAADIKCKFAGGTFKTKKHSSVISSEEASESVLSTCWLLSDWRELQSNFW